MKMEKIMAPTISVCVPAYNRPDTLSELIKTVLDQEYDDYELIVCEDDSPRSDEIRNIVEDYIKLAPGKNIRFVKNETNLGYDGNFRKLVDIARGKYCVFMGDDDLMLPGTLGKIASVIHNHENIGVILRTWGRIERGSNEIVETFRYFDGDRLFEAGMDSVVSLYRRSVAIAGYTVNRDLARQYATDKFDGTLLYQIYLTGMILMQSRAFYISSMLTVMRNGGDHTSTHFFGNAAAEKEKFKPGMLATDHSLNFIQGMIDIAVHVGEQYGKPELSREIIKDMGNYSYPLLSYHVDKSMLSFSKYYFSLLKMGLWRNPYIHMYFVALLALGKPKCERIIIKIKTYLNRTPKLGALYAGQKIN